MDSRRREHADIGRMQAVVDALAGPRCLGGGHRGFQIEDPRVRTHARPFVQRIAPDIGRRDVTR